MSPDIPRSILTPDHGAKPMNVPSMEAGGVSDIFSQAAIDVIAERKRHIAEEGWTFQHDDRHCEGELARAAAAYAHAAGRNEDDRKSNGTPFNWPWNAAWWKSTTRRRDLVKAGALILAEIDRLDRLEASTPTQEA